VLGDEEMLLIFFVFTLFPAGFKGKLQLRLLLPIGWWKSWQIFGRRAATQGLSVGWASRLSRG